MMKKHMSLITLVAALVGYGLALFCKSLDLANTSLFYQSLIFIKVSFISLLKMFIAPMIFFSLIGGIISIGNISKLKSMGKNTIIYYFSTTIIAIALGLISVKYIHPWTHYDQIKNIQTSSTSQTSSSKLKLLSDKNISIIKLFQKLVKKSFQNPFKSLSESNILGIVVFAIFAGLAILAIPGISQVQNIITEINQVIFKILNYIILLTPLGVFAIIFDFAYQMNTSIFQQLLSFSLLVFCVTAIHGLVVLPLIAKIFANISIIDFFKKASKPMFLAFSTSSSSATLPVTLMTCQKDFNVDESVASFVLPLGATMNMDGTALFEGIAAIFLAYLFNVELSSTSIFVIFFMAMISSIGAPGMPSASMAGMQMVLIAAGIPVEAIGILLIIEKPLDTFRTAVNVEGDIVGTLVTQAYVNKKNQVNK